MLQITLVSSCCHDASLSGCCRRHGYFSIIQFWIIHPLTNETANLLSLFGNFHCQNDNFAKKGISFMVLFFFFFLNKVTERHFDHFNRSIKNTQKVKMRKFFRESSSSNPKTIQILKTRKQTNHLADASWVLPDGCVPDWLQLGASRWMCTRVTYESQSRTHPSGSIQLASH